MERERDNDRCGFGVRETWVGDKGEEGGGEGEVDGFGVCVVEWMVMA